MATKKTTADEVESKDVNGGLETQKLEFIFVSKSDNGSKLEFMAVAEDSNPVTLKLPLMGYDEKGKKYVEDKDVYARSEETVKEVFGMTIEELLAQEDLMGTKFDAYYDGDRGSFSPIKPYVRYDRIELADSKMLKRYDGEFGPVMATESAGFRFNFGVSVNLDGEEKKFRVSQLKIEVDDLDKEDDVISIKYTNREIESFKKQIEEGNLSPEVVARMKPAIDKMIAKSRAAKIEEIERIIKGVDLEKMLAGEGTIVFNAIEVQQIPNNDVYFLVGRVDVEKTLASQVSDDK